MKVQIANDFRDLGSRAAFDAAAELREVLAQRGRANLVVATGTSQFEVLSQLSVAPQIDWSKVTGFHLDEYIGLGPEHPASFCSYLRERLTSKVPIRAFHFIEGLADDPKQECRRLGDLIGAFPLDLALIGIGENGHLAFNDPPADFETRQPYIVVELDERCRRQQLGEGWFDRLEDVPTGAISMSVSQILMADRIICSVPDERKASAVAGAIDGPVTPDLPASILQQHPNATIYLDRSSASQLKLRA